MSEFSEIEEMYLKTMFEIHADNPAAIVKTTQLADIKRVSAASVTEMIQRLSSRDMVTHIPYRGCRLTPSGFQLAARIKRREILLEILLTDVIGFDGDVHEVACKMEHAIGSDLESTLDRLLGYPEFSIEGEDTQCEARLRNYSNIHPSSSCQTSSPFFCYSGADNFCS